ncbi:type II and III secretion system protein family protein [Trinickia diaoshuihuensis]|jgi:pilus assembly protein CpaC|uniref:type II and III secretion system protein family protein n=1 Tax=Trinickia diaoshuihuensis TaxID=2292265 RepID=UPI000E26A27F|nr:type II and III secretion system protein family protein [Trinickia diaoshuihuensis]
MAKVTALANWRATAWVGACCAALLLYGAAGIAFAAGDRVRAAEPSSPATIALAVGEQRQLEPRVRLARVAVADPAVADVLVIRDGDGRGGVLAIGKAPGRTSLLLWEQGRSAPRAVTLVVEPGAAATLAGKGAPNVESYGRDVVVSGDTPTMETHRRGTDLARLAVNASARANGLRGNAQAAAGAPAGDGKASALEAGNIVDESSVATRSVVQVDVRVVEFSRTVLKQAGLNLFKQSNGFSFGTFAPSGLNSVSGGSTSSFQVTSTVPIASAFNLVLNSAGRGLFADLSLMESNNLARVLAEPTLVALSGQSASFLAGGEIPVPVPQALGTTSIDYKPYGVGLTLTPTVLSAQRIALKVAPEASQLDFQNAVTINGVSVPAITTRRADTTVELGDGESFVIGGLIDRETMSNVSKVPLLGDLPVIGAFFKQLNYQQNDKELVIVVTPHLISPLAKDAALPAAPGEQSEQRGGPVWRSYLGGALSGDAGPGFSR